MARVLKCGKEIELTGIPLLHHQLTDSEGGSDERGRETREKERKERERQEEGGYPARKGCDI